VERRGVVREGDRARLWNVFSEKSVYWSALREVKVGWGGMMMGGRGWDWDLGAEKDDRGWE